LALALLTAACAGDRPSPVEPSTGIPSFTMGTLSALVGDSDWNSGVVNVRHGGGAEGPLSPPVLTVLNGRFDVRVQ
jgi:hypothetical protein